MIYLIMMIGSLSRQLVGKRVEVGYATDLTALLLLMPLLLVRT